MVDITESSAGVVEKPVPWFALRWLLGIITLVLKSGSELTHLVGQMHRTWVDMPPPFQMSPDASNGQHSPDAANLPGIYRLIRLLLEQGAAGLHQLNPHLPTQDHLPQPLRRLLSGMNGVFGDKLRDWGHPLAQPLELVDHTGQPLTLPQLQATEARGILLFLHGLCLSEIDWQTPAHRRFVQDAQNQGLAVAWVRYNSGLPIWENGEALSRFLEAHWQPDKQQTLTLVGHSMGGLVIRGALHHGEQIPGFKWVKSLDRVACLASPHDGAPLEKIGNFANSLLGVSPYSKPLMALGNIRSLGIRSLRHGNVVAPVDASERQYPLPFNERVRHLLVAARMGDDPARRWLGDGLVPVPSAMGDGHFPSQHEQVTRVMLEDVGHIRLLADERTYEALRRWMEMPPVPA